MYIEIDHKPVPIHINVSSEKELLLARKKTLISSASTHDKEKNRLFKCYAKKEKINDVLQKFGGRKNKNFFQKDLECVSGSDGDVWFDLDWGFFSTILACYNNRWVLKTCPDDWWGVVVRYITQTIDEKSELSNIKDFFVGYEEEKVIEVVINGSLTNGDFNWLFRQFSDGVRKNIKTSEYVDILQADFTTTTTERLISTQIMLTSSMKKHFKLQLASKCGIPGIEMLGTYQDWEKLLEKINNLELLLYPIMSDLALLEWFTKTKTIFTNLLNTYHGHVNKTWWNNIFICGAENTSDVKSRLGWAGWLSEFFMYNGYNAIDYSCGIASIQVKIIDDHIRPFVEDTGLLVAGTVGFIVEEGERLPVVSAKQGWCLLMPQGSALTPRLFG